MSVAQDILVYLVAHASRPFKRTDLVKLVYLVDWEHLTLYGRQVTDIEWVRDYYGPYAHSIAGDLHQLQSREQIAVIETVNGYGGTMYLHKPTPKTRVPELPYQLEVVCDSILGSYGKLSLDKLKNAAYSTPPMECILMKERKEGFRVYGRALELDRFVPKRRKRVARREVALTTRGDMSQRCSTAIAEYQVWEESIRKANSIGLGEGCAHGGYVDEAEQGHP